MQRRPGSRGERVSCMAAPTSEIERSTGRVTKSHDDNFGRCHTIINQIWVGMREEATNARARSCAPGVRMLFEEGNNGYEAIPDLSSPLRRSLLNVGEGSINLRQSPACIADVHRPCFAHIARTSSGVASSPRSISASASAKSASSAGVSWIGGWSTPASCSMTRASSSCRASGRAATVLKASSRRRVMQQLYHWKWRRRDLAAR